MKKSFLLLFTLVLMLPFALKAQQITFSEPDKDDPRSYSFEVLGKIGGKILVYKNYRESHSISVFDVRQIVAILRFRWAGPSGATTDLLPRDCIT